MARKKEARIMVRVTPEFKERLVGLADKLHTNLSDLLPLGALLVELSVDTPAGYLQLKSKVISSG